MISNSQSTFSVQDFVESLNNFNEIEAQNIQKLPIKEAEKTGRFVKADLGMFRDQTDQSIWKIETADDGKQYITRTQEDEAGLARQGWSAIPNRIGDTITLAYKGVPIKKMSSVDFKFTPENIIPFARFVIQKAASNSSDFKLKLIASLDANNRTVVLNKFPELVSNG